LNEPIKFFLPGPTYVPMDARQAMTQPMVGHRSPGFKDFYVKLSAKLPHLLRTAGDVMVASGSSTLVMESAVVSCVREDVLCLTNGAFSERWHSIAKACGKSADQLAAPWGQAIDPETLRAALRRKRYEAITVVHNETSTGVMNPIAELAAVAREEGDALIIVDAVSSLGGARVETDDWGIDITLAGTQKAIAVPPGLTVFTLSARAAEQAKKVPHRGFYTDLLRYVDKHKEGGFITTPAIPLLWALDVQLDRILAEGMEARWARHQRLQEKTAKWAAERGCAYASAEGARSLTVSCFHPPAGVDPQVIVKGCTANGYTIGSGYGDWKPTTFRIGHMGEVRETDLDALLPVIDQILEKAAAPAAR
jgi:predicted phosphoserine aminotransferase